MGDDRPLVWYLERGLGRGMTLLRETRSDEAVTAVEHVCCHETRWDPDAEDRTFYLAKALAMIDDREVEERILDRWERELVWQYRGPWSEVGLVLAGRGHPRAIDLLGRETEIEVESAGPGPVASTEGMTDVAEWLEAIREDARLRVGGGLRVAKLLSPADRPKLRRALEDPGCPHLQEAVAVTFSRVADGEARTWLMDRVEAADGDRAYWWWQGLSGQEPCERARQLALDAVASSETPVANLGWALRTLLRNHGEADGARIVAAMRRALEVRAEDAVSHGLEFIARHCDAGYADVLLDTMRGSGYGANRREALETALDLAVEVPTADLSNLLEDADCECRLLALRAIDDDTARERLAQIARGRGEDPGFLAAATERFTG